MKSNTMGPSGRTLVAQIVIYYLKEFKPMLWNVVFSQNGRCADVFVFFLHTLSMYPYGQEAKPGAFGKGIP